MKKDYENYIHFRATGADVAAVEEMRLLTKQKQNLQKIPSAASVLRALIHEGLERARNEADSKPTN